MKQRAVLLAVIELFRAVVTS